MKGGGPLYKLYAPPHFFVCIAATDHHYEAGKCRNGVSLSGYDYKLIIFSIKIPVINLEDYSINFSSHSGRCEFECGFSDHSSMAFRPIMSFISANFQHFMPLHHHPRAETGNK